MKNKKLNYTTMLVALCLLVLQSCTATKDATDTADTSADKEMPNVEPKTFLADEKDACPDLIVGEIKIVEQKKSKVYLSYTITNSGTSEVNLMGENLKAETDNVAVKMYFSSDEIYQRGDILIGGDYVDNDFLATNEGKLQPGESYTGTVKISTKTKTSFTPYVVFDVDAWQTIRECNETNNQTAIIVD